MKIALDGITVTIDNEPAGTYDGTDYTPADGMTSRKINAVAKWLREQAKATPPEEFPSPDAGLVTTPDLSVCQSGDGIPQADPLLGDKTPEIVEWYRDNQPDEYERRYRGRKTHLGRFF